MFDFFFKKRPVTSKALQSASNQPAQTAADVKHSNKQLELEQAQGFAGQEDAALAFILQSGFADARFQAVQHIHSVEILTRVSQAMRNTDRRVAKIALEKLAGFEYRKKMQLAAQQCLERGQSLLGQAHLMANQISGWDKERLSLGEYGLSLLQIKSELEARLHEQFELQRQVLQRIAELHAVTDSCATVEPISEKIAEAERYWTQLQTHRLLESLPKNQLSQLREAIAQSQLHLQKIVEVSQLLARRADLLMGWENAEHNEAGQIQSEWQRLALCATALNEAQQQKAADQELQFTAILTRLAASKAAANSSVENPSDVAIQADVGVHTEVVLDTEAVQALLAALELALEQGSLQQALDIDKSLRSTAAPVRGALAQRLSGLRMELNRLLDWAKWGGNVSREELIKVADGLLQDDVAPTEIARRVGGLRARWKELDRASGAAGKLLWERFDASCSRAYAIADSYFKQQAQARLENLQAAQAQLTEIDALIAGYETQLPEWKVLQANISRVKTEWRKLGTIDRKFKAGLEREFEKKLALLTQPVLVGQETAIQQRQQLIQSVLAIDAADRDAVERIKLAQQHWQQASVSMNLNRKQDQELWRAFRAACDGVFAQRKQNAGQQKQERHQIILAKQHCCEQLENMQDKPARDILSALRSARLEWRELCSEAKGLEARFDAAVQNLEIRLGTLSVLERQAGLVNLKAKIELCQKIEAINRADSQPSEAEMSARSVEWQSEWDRLATVHPWKPLDKPLMQRFDQALEAFKNPRCAGQQEAQADTVKFAEHLLRLELMRNLPSPAELSQQRLQLQVRDLQSALKYRETSENYASNLCALCALPVLLNGQLEQRFLAVLEDWTKVEAVS